MHRLFAGIVAIACVPVVDQRARLHALATFEKSDTTALDVAFQSNRFV